MFFIPNLNLSSQQNNRRNRWWQLSPEETVNTLTSNLKTGLTHTAAQNRLLQFGPNQLKDKKGPSPFNIFIDQFRSLIVWVLIGAALVSGLLQEWIDAWAIIAIIILNGGLGFIQEFSAEKSLAALRRLSSPTTRVIRGGLLTVIPSSALVIGDLIEVEAGDFVPADCRLIYVSPNFATLEAALTGESTPSTKSILAIDKDELAIIERSNLIFMGTTVAAGKARALVVESAMRTELGKIAGIIQNIESDPTPLQKKLEEFGKWIVGICFTLVGIIFAVGMLHGEKLLDLFLTAVSLAVAAIPEGLPAVVTMALALGMKKMVKRHVLIRKLPSVETLGCATVICSDKTGTLTKNQMTVTAIYADDSIFRVSGIGYEPTGQFFNNEQAKITVGDAYPSLTKVLTCGVLCNGAQLVSNSESNPDKKVYTIIGDPTEGAILTCGAKAGIQKEALETEFTFLEEIPFDPVRKKMTVLRKLPNRTSIFFPIAIAHGQENPENFIAVVKGAPDILIRDCNYIEQHGRITKLSPEDKNKILRANEQLTNQALRVLAVAYKTFSDLPEKINEQTIEKELVFAGLIGMIDPPREEVKLAIQKCQSAGIKTIMITGDHKNTALAIAQELGIYPSIPTSANPATLALSGEELDQLSDLELKNKINEIFVYARVSPEHKYRIVKLLRQNQEIVAMTGDGVNDAPAVKEADIGVAMGITGTEVTKEVSDMVITDDNFTSIVAAVEEGRGIYDNIKKFIHYLLSCNTGEILVMLVAALLGLPAPLLPLQILWVNLMTDGLPALALGVDPIDPKIMQKPPRPKNETILTRRGAVLMLWHGSAIATCSLIAFTFVLFVEGEGIVRARTAAFFVLSVSQLFHAFNCRNFNESIFKIGVFSNFKLVLAFLVSLSLQLVVIYLPFFQKIFKTEALTSFDVLLVIILGSFPLWAMEIVKIFNQKLRQQKK